MRRIYVNEDYCIGCRLCEIHCMVQHSKSKKIVKAFKEETPRVQPRLLVEEEGPLSFAMQCRHCVDARCVEACISGAMHQDEQTGAVLKVAPISDRGELELEDFARLLGPRTRFVAITHASNALGTINPVQEIVRLAHEHGVPILLDGAQAVPHFGADVEEIGCDFYAFSGHKMYGPTGIGALYARAEQLEEMEAYQTGGEMILSVTFEQTTYNRLPHRFEAGTPNIGGAIALGTAIDYLTGLDLTAVAAHEQDLLKYTTREVSKVPGVRLIGTAASKTALLSFTLGDIHPHDVGTVLDQEGIAVRTGHHCAQPVMERFGVAATARASFAVYNMRQEVDRLVAGLHRALEIFG